MCFGGFKKKYSGIFSVAHLFYFAIFFDWMSFDSPAPWFNEPPSSKNVLCLWHSLVWVGDISWPPDIYQLRVSANINHSCRMFFRCEVVFCSLPETNSLSFALEIVQNPKRKGSSGNHWFSGANLLLVSGSVCVFFDVPDMVLSFGVLEFAYTKTGRFGRFGGNGDTSERFEKDLARRFKSSAVFLAMF